jgi:hypothetical protein
MNFLAAFILIFTLNSITANGSPVNPETELQLLGKGIEDRKTGETLAFACQDQGCSKIIAIHFSADKSSANYLGNEIVVLKKEDISDEKEFKEYFLQLQRAQKIEKEKGRSTFTSNLIDYSKFIGIFAVSGTVASVGFIVGIPMLAASSLVILPLLTQFAYTPWNSNNGTLLNATFTDDSGWNWAISPEKVSHRTFTAYQNVLSAPSETTSANPETHF